MTVVGPGLSEGEPRNIRYKPPRSVAIFSMTSERKGTMALAPPRPNPKLDPHLHDLATYKKNVLAIIHCINSIVISPFRRAWTAMRTPSMI